mmetsp:Transcript_69004/g.173840  ORF Transcript_69004/g.173840 Transcript_69004/m.173840 type:complete len:216 (+) Transcript_69004:1092-1739(+)
MRRVRRHHVAPARRRLSGRIDAPPVARRRTARHLVDPQIVQDAPDVGARAAPEQGKLRVVVEGACRELPALRGRGPRASSKGHVLPRAVIQVKLPHVLHAEELNLLLLGLLLLLMLLLLMAFALPANLLLLPDVALAPEEEQRWLATCHSAVSGRDLQAVQLQRLAASGIVRPLLLLFLLLGCHMQHGGRHEQRDEPHRAALGRVPCEVSVRSSR